MCPKDYIVQNNAWGSTAGQTITFGPGTKFKVTVQNENRTGNSTPAGYPSILTGAYDNRSTTRQRPAARDQPDRRGQPADQLHLGRQRRDRAATTPPTTSGSAPARAAIRRRQAPSGGYLMVWFYDPPDNQPIGALLTNGMGSATIGGKQFSVWYGTEQAASRSSRTSRSRTSTRGRSAWATSSSDAITRNCAGGDQVPELRAGT